MADIFSLIGPAKIIAKAIEHKFPGSCTDIIANLDHVQHDPHVIRYRVKELQEKWNEVKDSFSDSEQSDIESDMGMDLSDVDIANYPNPSDIVDIPDVPDDGGGLLEWFLALFS